MVGSGGMAGIRPCGEDGRVVGWEAGCQRLLRWSEGALFRCLQDRGREGWVWKGSVCKSNGYMQRCGRGGMLEAVGACF